MRTRRAVHTSRELLGPLAVAVGMVLLASSCTGQRPDAGGTGTVAAPLSTAAATATSAAPVAPPAASSAGSSTSVAFDGGSTISHSVSSQQFLAAHGDVAYLASPIESAGCARGGLEVWQIDRNGDERAVGSVNADKITAAAANTGVFAAGSTCNGASPQIHTASPGAPPPTPGFHTVPSGPLISSLVTTPFTLFVNDDLPLDPISLQSVNGAIPWGYPVGGDGTVVGVESSIEACGGDHAGALVLLEADRTSTPLTDPQGLPVSGDGLSLPELAVGDDGSIAFIDRGCDGFEQVWVGVLNQGETRIDDLRAIQLPSEEFAVAGAGPDAVSVTNEGEVLVWRATPDALHVYAAPIR